MKIDKLNSYVGYFFKQNGDEVGTRLIFAMNKKDAEITAYELLKDFNASNYEIIEKAPPEKVI